MIEDKLNQIFSTVFEVDINDVSNISYQSVEGWDSIGHMMMISEVEAEFGISIDMNDVIVISNLAECINIISKYVES